MAKISNFIYCLNAITTDTDANVMGVLSAITPEYLPGSFSFSILCSIVDIDDGNHAVKMNFISPDGETLVNIDAVIPYKRNSETNLPKEYVGVNICSTWQNVIFKTSGLYKTIVSVDGCECGVYEIYVKGKNEGE